MAEKSKEELMFDALDHYAAGRLHEAVAAYKNAIRLDEDFVEAHLGLAKAYEMMGTLNDAIAVLHDAADRFPTEPFIHTSLSQCLQKQGLIPEAEEEAAIASQLNRLAMR